MQNILIIARRDLRAQFNSPVAYVVLGGSMLLLGVLVFWVPALMGRYWDLDRASVVPMFTYLPWLMSVFVIPAVTMRSMAGEKGSGTLELLITMPVRDSDVILGKYVAALTSVLVLLAATLIYPLAMFWWPWHLGALDWGPVLSGYLGCTLFSAAAVGLGMMLSSLTESEVMAFFMTLASLFFLYFVGSIVSLVPGGLADAISFVSFQSRYQSFALGLIDTRAVIYFLSVTVICLLVAFRSLESRKWS
jgi:ABC-2 type transport system permease protein